MTYNEFKKSTTSRKFQVSNLASDFSRDLRFSRSNNLIKKVQTQSSMDEETYQFMKTVVGYPRMQSTPKRSDALCSALNNDQVSKKRGLEEQSSSTMNQCD